MPDNYAIADQFSLLSKLMDIHQENSFKSKSYAAAAFSIEKLPVQLTEVAREELSGLKGIGSSAASKIAEILDTGKLSALEELVAKTPQGVLEMMQIKGLGPKKICTIWKEMGIESIGELLYACNENRLLLYKGFGEKTQKNVAEAIGFYLRHQGHFLYAEIEEYGEHLIQILEKYDESYRWKITGDFKRQMPTLEKLQILTDCPAPSVKGLMTANGFQEESSNDKTNLYKGAEQIQIEIISTEKEIFTATEFKLNASDAFIDRWMKEFADSLKGASSDEEIFKYAGINYIPAYLREEPGILDSVKTSDLREVIQVKDIKGIIHTHSDWSDGLQSVEDMARSCMQQGFEYLVISDHSKSAFYANGLSEERIKAQHQYVDELNGKFAPFKIFKSIECDILNDGSLDYSDNILSTFDLVIASVHSNLKMSEEKAMQRIINAIEHPATRILGHPTGRLLLSRAGYPINHEKMIDACIANKVVIEINAHPRRLDLDWSWIRLAQEKGAILSINPDAHNTEGYKDIRYGVLASQKGGLLSSNNLSSYGLTELEEFLINYR
ncbi:DNA polymerase/3'-5' exonuclease PolX [Bacteroidota bacterium]|nr:DNA polymerase/3'-5' exonuclease PolX [Bacteroidota bacterium]